MTATEDSVELWLLPAAFDFDEDNWRAMRITFSSGACTADVITDLELLAREFEVQKYDLEHADLPIRARRLGSCRIHFETDLSLETAALLLYRAANLIRSAGVPTENGLVVLSDPDHVGGCPGDSSFRFNGNCGCSRAQRACL